MGFEKGHDIKKETLVTRIILDENYKIEIDTMGNHTLIYEIEGKKTPVTIGYYSNIASALKSFRNQLVNDGSKYTIKEYIDKMEEFNEYMEGLIK
jgi:hypothetical protein